MSCGSGVHIRKLKELTLPQLIYSTAVSRKKKYMWLSISYDDTKLGSGRERNQTND